MNNITFTSKEQVLIAPMSQICERAGKFVSEASILPTKNVVEGSQKAVYTSPFAPINEKTGKFLNIFG